MGLVIYLNGEFVDEEEAKISVFDHGVLYGDGVFEGIRAYNGRVFRLRQHIDRLYESAKSILLDIGMTKEEMSEALLETLRRNNLRDAYIRLVVTRGKGDLGLDPRMCSKPTVFIIAAQIQLYPEELYEKGLEVVTVPTRRNIVEGVNPRIKSLNYLNNILAKIEANLAGVSEAILLNSEGYVTECTGDNIFIVKNGEVITPPPFLGILEGVTRNSILEIAEKLGYRTAEKVFTRHDLYVADECFLTGTAAEVVPVVKVDGRVIGEDGKPGKITATLIREFRKLTAVDGTEIYPNR
ncbi:MAG: branched-chain amino acid aminotransferase [Clostridia bacterium]|jgi:branched-chain amino acid aminotransferase|uniref:Branched-chain-amino-acid aminotransferase n=1 Tax=Thermacetogenium phaeum TaxID=85874 RepID=A0A101FET0_9THEO|nr:MAG: Branched-chain-amino-acid aminotransferase IlvE [Thermacetogenium phaeum]MDK2881147.1 branched-chain amino acid aminotransferase [Clostridia bacterium]MDN5366441.1 branched-chain amino acid aminotransferase [Thermacetogenium sp.]MDN5375529.1 branched-chain amino acid aminotransferase [Thermacetogenium sp.]